MSIITYNEKPVEGNRIYKLFKVYPNGTRYFLAYCRTKIDCEFGILEADPESLYEPYEVRYEADTASEREVPPNREINDYVERKRKEDEATARFLHEYAVAEQKHKEACEAYEREQREWEAAHPGQKRPLITRRFPPGLIPSLIPSIL